jgi:hypothetical protein
LAFMSPIRNVVVADASTELEASARAVSCALFPGCDGSDIAVAVMGVAQLESLGQANLDVQPHFHVQARRNGTNP